MLLLGGRNGFFAIRKCGGVFSTKSEQKWNYFVLNLRSLLRVVQKGM